MGNLIYIGRHADMDVNEGNYTIDNAAAVTGTYGAGDMQNIDVTFTSSSGRGFVSDDDRGATPDDFIYDTGDGTVTSGLDSEARFAGTVTDGDGQVHSITMSVYQTQNGDTFVKLPNGYDVSEISIDRVVGDGYSGIWNYASSSSTVVCFCAGTEIATPEGLCLVENLAPGDVVLTLDRGAQRVRWRNQWHVDQTTSENAPILIAAGALGSGLPRRPLKVSPQHRLLLTSPVAQRMFDAAEILVPALHLVGFPGIQQAEVGQSAHYVHFLCSRHELVGAEGIAVETLLLAEQSLKIVQAGGSASAPTDKLTDQRPVRPIQTGRRLKKWGERHRKNTKPLRAVAFGDMEKREPAVPITDALMSMAADELKFQSLRSPMQF